MKRPYPVLFTRNPYSTDRKASKKNLGSGSVSTFNYTEELDVEVNDSVQGRPSFSSRTLN